MKAPAGVPRTGAFVLRLSEAPPFPDPEGETSIDRSIKSPYGLKSI